MVVLTILDAIACGPCHPSNTPLALIKRQGSGKWTSVRGSGKTVLQCTLHLPRATIKAIDLGNFWSAVVEISVSNEGDDHQQLLLPRRELMTRSDVTMGRRGQDMIFLTRADMINGALDKTWTRLHVTCHQPHRRDVFGLAALVLHGEVQQQENSEERQEPKAASTGAKEKQLGAGQLLMDKAISHLAKGSPSSRPSPKQNFLFRQRVRRFLNSLKVSIRENSSETLLRLWFESNPDQLNSTEKRALEELVSEHLEREGGIGLKRRAVSDTVLRLGQDDDLDIGATKRPRLMEGGKSRNERSSMDQPGASGTGEHSTERRLGSFSSDNTSNSAADLCLPSTSKAADQKTACPLCNKWFDNREIERHCATCQGEVQDENMPSPVKTTQKCPICQNQYPAKELEKHAQGCAASMFGE